MSNTFDELIKIRRKKLDTLREQGNAYPNGFKVNTTISQFISSFKDCSKERLEQIEAGNDLDFTEETHSLAGRIKLHRVMGKTSFAHIGDEDGTLQLYLRRENESGDGGIPREEYNAFKKYDLGDIIGVEGTPYRTNKGELSLRVHHIQLLAKSILPLPDKHHGLVDGEIKCRQRYLDLMVNQESMDTFKARSRIVRNIRQQMEDYGFTEVETPMMHPIPGGATARPFITHHNTLDMDLYLRIAPELYLKRLIVGGFTKVYEINRNFRNEGLSPRHNPEFSMMEFYAAYWDYMDLMAMTEVMLSTLAIRLHGQQDGSVTFEWQDKILDFSMPFKQMTMKEAVLEHCHWVVESDFSSLENAQDLWLRSGNPDGSIVWARDEKTIPKSIGEIVTWLFEEYVEHQLIQPTFITHYPVEVSPLARRNDKDPTVTDRFELFIAGQEVANGFSELNDPDDQAERFQVQVTAMEGGDKEAMHYDKDYITALQYGMPPTAGEGIGIDRLVAILLNKANIRDVILFPQMRPTNA